LYYFKGIGFGLGMVLAVLAIMFIASIMGLRAAVVELVVYFSVGVVLGVLGFKFKGETNLSLIELFHSSKNLRYLYFPFGVSTVTAITQASINLLGENDSLLFWFIPVAVIGQGLGLSTFILIGMWCNRSNA